MHSQKEVFNYIIADIHVDLYCVVLFCFLAISTAFISFLVII